MLCAELRKKVLRFAVQPENSLRKHADFFDKVGSFVAKRGDFFVFVAHFSIALTEFALRRGSRTESFRTFRPFVSPSRFLHPPRRFHLADTPLHTRRDGVRALHRVPIFYVHPSPRF